MLEQPLLLRLAASLISDNPTSLLRQEYQAFQKLYRFQTPQIQQYLASQAGLVANGIVQGETRVEFCLPEQVVCLTGLECEGKLEKLPSKNRSHKTGGLVNKLSRTALCTAVSKRLSTLEQSANSATSISAGLLRYSIAVYMIYQILPAGKSVIYAQPEGEDIPNRPVKQELKNEYLDKVKVDHPQQQRQYSAEKQPEGSYVESAKCFFLPQWIAFDDEGRLLSGNLLEAEAHFASMQKYLGILNLAITIAPYMVTDETWQGNHYGILGQLVNQGRSLARYQTQEIIQGIQSRVAEGKLDRGLRLSLPYFDDKKLAIENYDFMIIPNGRIMFISAFTVLAARDQQLKIARDGRFSFETRKHLIRELHSLEMAFRNQV